MKTGEELFEEKFNEMLDKELIRQNLMINETKILDYLQNELKLPLVRVTDRHEIVVKSAISNIKSLVEFVEPLHYWVSYVCNSIYINPNK